MKITLIAPILSELGLCTISPLLKREGHQVNLLFIPELLQDCSTPLSQESLRNIKEFINGSDIIGINSLSENYSKTAILVDEIKKGAKIPIVWGGIHATIRPQDCIQHADIVCVGEGEEAISELARRLGEKDRLENIKNLLFQHSWNDKKEIELYPPINLDSLLPLDYDLKTQYILENNRVRSIEEEDFKGTFFSFSSRGCPFRCSYCCNAVIHNMYNGQKILRQRNTENVINELKEIKRRFSSCRDIWFNEADFLSGKTQKEIEDFSKRYKREIDIPFAIWSNPAAISDDTIRALKNAGLVKINLGTVNGNDSVQRLIYKRNASAALYIDKAKILKKYGINVEYDFILCNPYENEDDIISTIKLLMRLPKPFRTVIYVLTYFPKTELYEMALRDGVISEKQVVQSYTKAAYKAWQVRDKNDYVNIVASMMRGQAKRIDILGLEYYGILPKPVLKSLINKPIIGFFKHMPLRTLIYQGIGNFIMISYLFTRKILSSMKRFSDSLPKYTSKNKN